MTAAPLTPALKRLFNRPAIQQTSSEDLEKFIAHGDCILFFTGDALRYPEIDDVAVILPELMATFHNRFKIGVINPDTERAIARRFQVAIRPSLAFLRNGDLLGVLPRVRDWAVYLDEIHNFYNAAAQPVPEIN